MKPLATSLLVDAAACLVGRQLQWLLICKSSVPGPWLQLWAVISLCWLIPRLCC